MELRIQRRRSPEDWVCTVIPKTSQDTWEEPKKHTANSNWEYIQKDTLEQLKSFLNRRSRLWSIHHKGLYQRESDSGNSWMKMETQWSNNKTLNSMFPCPTEISQQESPISDLTWFQQWIQRVGSIRRWNRSSRRRRRRGITSTSFIMVSSSKYRIWKISVKSTMKSSRKCWSTGNRSSCLQKSSRTPVILTVSS